MSFFCLKLKKKIVIFINLVVEQMAFCAIIKTGSIFVDLRYKNCEIWGWDANEWSRS